MPLQFGEFELDRERRQLLRSGQPVPLEPKAYELLSLLVERRPRALSRAQIRDVVWPGVFVSESTLGVAVNAIRQALGDDARKPRFIRTVHGFGYAFCGEVAGDGDKEAVKAAEPRGPYPGLSSFVEEDAEVFFGRETEVEALWERIQRRTLLALIGPSGAGKTSFLQAGVIPARPEGWEAIVCVPGRAPMAAVARALAPRVAGDPEAVTELLGFEDPDVAVTMLRRWRQGHGEALLVVDQLEELFTLNPPDTQGAFADLLGRLANDADVHVLLSLRDDFLIRCHEHEALEPVFTSELTPLLALVGEDLRRALVEPARREGFAFDDDGLVEEMLGAVEGERGALPLLAFAVSRLWEKRDRGRNLVTRSAYGEIGGVAGALAQHADQTLERIGPEREPIVRELFRNLVTAQQTRAAADREELLTVLPDPEVGAHVLDQLIDARLLTSYEERESVRHSEPASDEDRPSRHSESVTASARTTHLIEIVHESLLRAWPRLVRWQAQDEEGALLRDQLKQAAHLWEQKGRPDDLLWTGTSEREFELWRERYPGNLTVVEEDFSRAMVDRARRHKRLRRLVTASVVTIAAIVASVTGVLWRTSEAARQRAEAEVRQREAAQILSLGRLRLEGHPTAALAYALASLERADSEHARRLAVEALWKGPVAHVITDAINPVLPVWSPDGQWLAVGGTAGLFLIDREGGRHRLLDTGQGWPIGFSADGSRLVTAEDTPAFHVWSFPGLERLDTWTPTFAGDVALIGRQVLTFEVDEAGPPDRQVIVRGRSIDGGPERALGRWPSANIDSRGEWLVTVEGGRVLRRRVNALEAPPRVIGRHDGEVSVGMGPSADRIATANATGEIRLWDADAGRLERTLRSPTAARGITLDPSGRYLAAAPGINEALPPRSFLLFDLEAPRGADPLALLNDEIEWLNFMNFHPEGHLLASCHYPYGLLLWNLAARRSIVLRGQNAGLMNVAFTPDGRLVSTSDEGVVRLWPLWAEPDRPARELRSQPGRELLGGGLDVSPDGRFAVVVDRSAGQLIVLPLDGSAATELPVKGLLLGRGLASDGRRVAVTHSEFGRPDAAALRVVELEAGGVRTLGVDDTTGACVINSPSLGPWQVPYWLPDGRLISEGALGLRLWDLADGSSQQIRACRDSSSFPPYLAATPDSRTVLSLFDPRPAPGETSVLNAFDLTTRTSREITAHGNRVSNLALDPTGTILVTGDMEGLVRVGPLSGGEPHLLYGHSQTITGLAVSPDGQWIASASNDGTIRLWPMPDGSKAPLHTLPYEELLPRFRAFTNLRVVTDDDSDTGYRVEAGPFPGWAVTPEW